MRPRRTARRAAAALAALAIVSIVPVLAARAAADAPPVFQGTWIATAGSSTFHGKWSAQAIPGQRDQMQGSWSLVNDAGDTATQGTWSAERSKRGFEGKWAARAVSGGSYRGTFEAHLPGFKGKTLEEMFAETKTKQISGTWKMGRATGAWVLKGTVPSP